MKEKSNFSDLVVEFILTYPERKLGDLTIGRIIDEFGVSRAQLFKQFKNSKNFTIKEFINQQKIIRSALMLLSDKELTVKTVSEEMGFCNSEYFIHVFEKYFGITPGRYKRLFLEKKYRKPLNGQQDAKKDTLNRNQINRSIEMKEEKFVIHEENKENQMKEVLDSLFRGIYSRWEVEELQESSLLMEEWSKKDCFTKCVGGMEEWAKEENAAESPEELCCDWYHGTWQYMRLLDMVAVPRWYPFYHEALCEVLRRTPRANVMISACADLGMLHTLDAAIRETGAEPTIVIYDICKTPLRNSEWYARRHNLTVTCICDNIITAAIEESSFDLVTTDEFLTVLKDPYKPLIVEKWKKILKPDGTLVTTAMIGKSTTPELREGYAKRAVKLFEKYGSTNFPQYYPPGEKKQKLLNRFHRFAMYHTRHMIKDEKQLKQLFKGFKYLTHEVVTTPGECVNPTNSFQIVARPKN